MNAVTLQTNTSTSSTQRSIIQQVENAPLMPRVFSPIERWDDENYAPHTLNFAWNTTPESYQIIAPIDGFKAADVHVDLRGDHVIILLSRTHRGGSALQEYYRKVEIPSDARKDVVWLEIDREFLTVTLRRKDASAVKRLLAFLS